MSIGVKRNQYGGGGGGVGKRYIVKDGVLQEDFALFGGRSSNGYANISYSISGNTASFSIGYQAWLYSSVFVNEMVDVTDATKIHIEGEFHVSSGTIRTAANRACASKTNPQTSSWTQLDGVDVSSWNQPFVRELDVSNETGLVYIALINGSECQASASGYIRIDNLWIE